MTTLAQLAPTVEGASTNFGTGRARTIIPAGILALGAVVVATVLLFRPWPVRNSFLYDELAPVRDGIWASILVDSLAFAAVAIGLSLVVVQLTPSRGSMLANVGAVVATVGGVLFAMGAFAFAMFTWYVTDPAVLPIADGTRLLDYAVANPEHGMLLQMGGFLLYMLGTLFLAAALFRARSVPRWLPIGMVVLTIAQFATHDRVLDFVQIVAMTVLVALAALALRQSVSRQSRTPRSAAVPLRRRSCLRSRAPSGQARRPRSPWFED
jgi:hypothetical protein